MTIELSREGGDIRLFITLVPKVLRWSFNIRWLNNFRHFHWILIGWFINLSVQRFQPLWTFYRSRSFVYYLRRCTSIYRPLSYPFRSLINNRETKMTKLLYYTFFSRASKPINIRRIRIGSKPYWFM